MALNQQIEAREFSYQLLPWGDLVYGSKAELQALGIAPGRPFPGESGAPPRRLRGADPRGFPFRLERAWYGVADYFVCSINLPGRARPQPCRSPNFAPGVTREEHTGNDLYIGSAEALIAAELIRADQLPGAPGRLKTVAAFRPDGTYIDLPACSPRHGDQFKAPGTMTITKAGAKRYIVYIIVPGAVTEQRRAAERAREQEWLARVATLPRPAPLVAPDREAQARQRRAQLRLAWSRPAFQPTITLPK